MVYIYGPTVAKRDGMTIYCERGLIHLSGEGVIIGGKQNCISRGSKYMIQGWLQTTYLRSNVTASELQYNEAISVVQEMMEWT